MYDHLKRCYVQQMSQNAEYLQGVPGGVHAEAERLVKRGLAVVAAHSGLLLDDPFLGGDVHHVQLHVEVCQNMTGQNQTKKGQRCQGRACLFYS